MVAGAEGAAKNLRPLRFSGCEIYVNRSPGRLFITCQDCALTVQSAQGYFVSFKPFVRLTVAY